jgi:hypothetical protein
MGGGPAVVVGGVKQVKGDFRGEERPGKNARPLLEKGGIGSVISETEFRNSTSLRQAEEALKDAKEADVGSRPQSLHLAKNFEEFMVGRTFEEEWMGPKAWAVYQQASRAEKGVVIGHDNAPIDVGFDGWQALRVLPTRWHEDINNAWIDGAVDAGLPVRLATPFEKVRRGTVTWREIERVLYRGGTLIVR